jgi:acetyl/propionyl-CoA carboxylase alpha subunit
VPVVPGSLNADDIPTLMEEAARIRYPVMVKAVAGGGGKGMRVVWDAADLPEELDAARREAEGAFADGRLLLEKYVPYARHVEFQILGDSYGNLVHLFERECSIQRRHQKIIEETPSPLLDAALREAMGAAALAAARTVGYENAGTVEFIVDPAGRTFYFLEMNTRLQVEHPITEAVTGLDLVVWQLRIASGERLPFRQADLAQRGHALECRVYAEDPAQGFLPASGRLLRFVEPRGPGVRVDAGFASGDSVGTHYDSLLAKVIVHAESRGAAIRRMQAALAEAVLLGLTTNREFLLDALAQPEFQAGEATTHFVERHFPAWEPDGQEVPAAVLIAAALGELGALGGEAPAPDGPDPYSPWDLLRGFRLGGDGS